MKDPTGDDRGAGTLRYPTHPIFEKGLFDLRQFKVSYDEAFVYFDLEFGLVTNPFHAPEGYFHQRIEIYIDKNRDQGNEKISLPGIELRLPEEHRWEARVRVGPFGGTALFNTASMVPSSVFPAVSSTLLDDGRTIQVRVSRELLLTPTTDWHYYVLVGGFDGLGYGQFRPLTDQAGEWTFGGEGWPIVDVLAPSWGTATQNRQLKRGELYPVGPGWVQKQPWASLALFIAIVLGTIFWGAFFLRRFWTNRNF